MGRGIVVGERGSVICESEGANGENEVEVARKWWENLKNRKDVQKR
jgi:hypothetical protein